MSADLPCIIIPPQSTLPPDVGAHAVADWGAALGGMTAQLQSVPPPMLRELVHGLVDEGKRFSGTASGQRWQSILASSDLIAQGWMVWNQLNLGPSPTQTVPADDKVRR